MSDSADEWMVLRQRGHGMAPWIALDWIGWDDFDPVLISNHLVEFNPLPKKTLRQNVENMQINPLFGVRFIETFFWNSPCPAEALKTIKTFWRNFWVPVNIWLIDSTYCNTVDDVCFKSLFMKFRLPGSGAETNLKVGAHVRRQTPKKNCRDPPLFSVQVYN